MCVCIKCWVLKILLFVVVMSYAVTVNTELMNTELLLLREIQANCL